MRQNWRMLFIRLPCRWCGERGYNIGFARDAMTDMVHAAHENSLSNIFPGMGEVDDTRRIIEKLG
jgi:hypothetical protein